MRLTCFFHEIDFWKASVLLEPCKNEGLTRTEKMKMKTEANFVYNGDYGIKT